MKASLVIFGSFTVIFIIAVICGATHYTMPAFVTACLTLAAYLEHQTEKEEKKNTNRPASHD